MASGRGWNKHRRNVGNAGIAGNVSNVCCRSPSKDGIAGYMLCSSQCNTDIFISCMNQDIIFLKSEKSVIAYYQGK